MKNRFQNICHIYFPDLYLPSTYDKLISNQLKKLLNVLQTMEIITLI